MKRAKEILSDAELKQRICNQIVGASHRDIEKALKDIVVTKLSQEDEEEQELNEIAPEKLHPEVRALRKVTRTKMEYMLDQDEVNRLIYESTAPCVDAPTVAKQNYPTYSPEEVQAIMRDNYDPTKFPKKR